MNKQPDTLGFLIGDVQRLMRRQFQQQLEGSCLTLAQARALVHIARSEGIRQVDLAERLDIQPITLARQLDQMAENGLVERRSDPHDRPAYQLSSDRRGAPPIWRRSNRRPLWCISTPSASWEAVRALLRRPQDPARQSIERLISSLSALNVECFYECRIFPSPNAGDYCCRTRLLLLVVVPALALIGAGVIYLQGGRYVRRTTPM